MNPRETSWEFLHFSGDLPVEGGVARTHSIHSALRQKMYFGDINYIIELTCVTLLVVGEVIKKELKR